MKLSASSAIAAALYLTWGVSHSATWEVTVTNVTHGNHFTPLLLTAHNPNTHLFKVGEKASTPLEHMAECGHLGPLLATAEVGDADADTIANPAGGLLAPGASTTATISTSETYLSIVAMVLPTNDAFVGMESKPIPAAMGTYTYYLNAYDAGTEQNDEVLMTSGNCTYTDTGMMPGAPGGDNDTGATGVTTTDTNTMIHIHRGVLGESEATGAGKSDLLSTIHRWQNPVAKVTVKVTP